MAHGAFPEERRPTPEPCRTEECSRDRGRRRDHRRSILLPAILVVLSVFVSPLGVSAIVTDSANVPGNTFSTREYFPAEVRSVQSGTITNTANGAQSVTITQ